MSDNANGSWARLRLIAGGGQAAEPKPAPALPILRFEDIQPVLETSDFVQGVLVEGSAAVVYGESNAGKTFWATDLALHVAAGMPWNGRRVEQGGVIYCALEGGVGFRNRVAAWRTDNGMDDARIPFSAIPVSLNLLDPEADTSRLITAIHAEAARMGMPIKLVVIDTLARAFAGGNENASEDMGLLVHNMDQIRAATGACVLFIHHCGKDAAKGARGHSSLRAAVDTEIEVASDAETGAKAATVVKQRELAKGQAFGFTLETVVLGQNPHGEDVTTCLVRSTGAQADNSGHSRSVRMSGDQQAAYSILCDLLAERGVPDYRGVPNGSTSVPDQWWRERFYQRAKPGADEATKQKAFRRAADALMSRRVVGMDYGRVWLP
jgi:RecA/RadA recombinase